MPYLSAMGCGYQLFVFCPLCLLHLCKHVYFSKIQFHLLDNLQPASRQGHSYSLGFCRRSSHPRVLTGSIDLSSAPSRRCLRPDSGIDEYPLPDPTRPGLFFAIRTRPELYFKISEFMAASNLLTIILKLCCFIVVLT